MQPIRVLQTIRWIQRLVPKDVSDVFFSYRLVRPAAPKEDSSLPKIAAIQDMVRITTIIQQSPEAVEVVRAFGLERLLDKIYFVKLIRSVQQPSPSADSEHRDFVIRPWEVMTGSAKPLQTLTTPERLVSDKVPDDVISLEIWFEGGTVPLQTLLTALQSLQAAYAAIARVYLELNVESKLNLLLIQSGSTIRIDCTGLEKAISALKQFVHETWNKIKYKRADELIQNNSAVLSTLATIQEIDRKVQNGAIGPEEGEQFKKVLLSSTMSLFETGALPTDISRQEHQQDVKLLQGFAPKLLKGHVEPEKVKKGKAKRSQRKPVSKKRDFDLEIASASDKTEAHDRQDPTESPDEEQQFEN